MWHSAQNLPAPVNVSSYDIKTISLVLYNVFETVNCNILDILGLHYDVI
jgi:hypothetical protein